MNKIKAVMRTKVKYPTDLKQLDDFYKEWYDENKHLIAETWQRPDVYDFASKYAKLLLLDVSNSFCVNCGKAHDDHRPRGGLCDNKRTLFKAK